MALLLGACELTHIFIRKLKHCSNYAENIRHHYAKYNRPGDLVPWISAPPDLEDGKQAVIPYAIYKKEDDSSTSVISLLPHLINYYSQFLTTKTHAETS